MPLTQKQNPKIAHRKILISQAPAVSVRTAYMQLAKQYGWEVDFVPFTVTHPVSSNEFRKHQASIAQHTAIVFTNTLAIDFFFRLCREVKAVPPADFRYFCATQPLASYLQKYAQPKKRKVLVASSASNSFRQLLDKHADEKFLLPSATNNTPPLAAYFSEKGYTFSQIPVYAAVSRDLTALPYTRYQLIVFFTPAGVQAFLDNFPQVSPTASPILAAFGSKTQQALARAQLSVAIQVPTNQAPSMVHALEQYLQTLAEPVTIPVS